MSPSPGVRRRPLGRGGGGTRERSSVAIEPPAPHCGSRPPGEDPDSVVLPLTPCVRLLGDLVDYGPGEGDASHPPNLLPNPQGRRPGRSSRAEPSRGRSVLWMRSPLSCAGRPSLVPSGQGAHPLLHIPTSCYSTNWHSLQILARTSFGLRLKRSPVGRCCPPSFREQHMVPKRSCGASGAHRGEISTESTGVLGDLIEGGVGPQFRTSRTDGHSQVAHRSSG